jgi:hypothetical protein
MGLNGQTLAHSTPPCATRLRHSTFDLDCKNKFNRVQLIA